MDINQSLDWHLDHDFVLMHPWGRQEQRGPCHLAHPFCDLWKDIFSEEKQNKSIYLLKLQILKHPASCAKEYLVGKKRKDESKYYAAPVMNSKVVSK